LGLASGPGSRASKTLGKETGHQISKYDRIKQAFGVPSAKNCNSVICIQRQCAVAVVQGVLINFLSSVALTRRNTESIWRDCKRLFRAMCPFAWPIPTAAPVCLLNPMAAIWPGYERPPPPPCWMFMNVVLRNFILKYYLTVCLTALSATRSMQYPLRRKSDLRDV
jgi:hypothetical protein